MAYYQSPPVNDYYYQAPPPPPPPPPTMATNPQPLTSYPSLHSQPSDYELQNTSPPPNFEYKPYSNASYTPPQPQWDPYNKPYQHSSVEESFFQQTPYNPIQHYRKRSLKSYVCLWMSFLAGVVWIGPAIYLLYINVTEFAIGASAWCPHDHCSVVSYWPSSSESSNFIRAAKANDDDRDLLGALQFAAKAFEVWFMAIAGSLVYTVARMVAKKPGGLPVGYMLTHLEFGDLRNLFNPTLYTSSRSRRGDVSAEGLKHKKHLYAFAAMAAVMCIVANLMGPLTAVLIIPSTDWVNADPVGARSFSRVHAEEGPSNAGTSEFPIPGCSNAELEVGNYSCMSLFYGSSLDSLIELSLASLDQTWWQVGDDDIKPENFAPTIENVIPFSFNFTYDNDRSTMGINSGISWAPNRQVIRELAAEFRNLSLVVRGLSDDPEFPAANERYLAANNSLAIELERQGPVIGSEFLTANGNLTLIWASMEQNDDRQIRCTSGFYTTEDGTVYHKCFRAGTMWSDQSSTSAVHIDREIEMWTEIFSYWSDNSVYIPSDDPNSWDPCLADVQFDTVEGFEGGWQFAGDCDWDAMFSIDWPAGMPSLPRDGFISESWMMGSNDSWALTSELHPFTGVATYSIDVTDVFPQMSEVHLSTVPEEDSRTPIVLHADWFLSIWGQDARGSEINITSSALTQGTSGAGKVRGAVAQYYAYLNDDVSDMARWTRLKWQLIAQNSFLHTLSLVTYDDTEAAFAEDQQATNPVLQSWYRYRVWKYGLETRTSKFAAIITLLGVLTVVARSILLLVDGEYKPSTVELMTSALEHQPKKEFDSTRGRSDASKVRFRMPAVADGKIEFSKA